MTEVTAKDHLNSLIEHLKKTGEYTNKLKGYVESIFHPDIETQSTLRYMFARKHTNRNQFLKELNKKLGEQEFDSKKQRSKAYSDAVVAYDKGVR